MLIVIILIGIIFVIRIQPMFIIRILIIIVILYSYIIYIIIGRYWYGYALIIIILSGVLVVFTYMVSLIPNERFDNYNLIYIMGFLFMLVGFYYIWIYELKFVIISLNLWTFLRLFNIFIVRFLLIIMLLVVWLRYIGRGALRVI